MATVFMFIAMAATLVVLIVGIFGMARGGEFNAKYSNKIMRMRIVLQGLAILFFVIALFASGRI